MPDDLRLNIAIGDDASQELDRLEDSLEDVGDEAKKQSKRWGKHWKEMERDVGKVHGAIKRAMTSLPALLGGVGLAGAFAMITKGGLEVNATLQSIETQFRVIVGDADKTRKIMADIVEFSAKTPFQLAEVAKAGKIMQAFGLGGIEWLEKIGDAAAAAGRPIDQIAMVMGKIKAGAYGEAFMRLAETGLATREMLEMQGLTFDPGGAYKGSAEDALAAVEAIFTDRFGGMMLEMSKTWEGAMSTLKDNWGLARAALTRPLFELLLPKIIELTAAVQDFTKTERFKEWSEAIEASFSRAIAFGQALAGFIGKNIKAFDIMGATLQGVALGIGVVVVAVTAWTKAQAIYNAIAAMNPYFLIVAGVAALVGVIYKVVDATIGWGKVWAYTKASAIATWEFMKAFWTSLKAGVKFAVEDFSTFATFLWDVFKWAITGIWDYWKTLWESLRSFGDDVGSIFKNLGDLIWKAMTFQWDDVKVAFDNLTASLGTAISDAFDVIKEGAAEKAAEMGEIYGKVTGTEAGKAFHETVTTAWAEAGTAAGAAFARAAEDSREATATGGDGEAAPAGYGEAIYPRREDFPSAGAIFPSREDFEKWFEDIAAAEQEFIDFTKALWGGYWGELTFMAQDFFSDTLGTMVLESGESFKESMDQIWDNLKESFVRMTIDMAAAWVFSKLRMAVASRLFESAATATAAKGAATRIALSQAEAASNRTETSTDVTSSAAKIEKAHAGIPLVGPTIAAALIAQMMATMAAVSGGSKFLRAGGYLGHFGSGAEDDQMAFMSGGEYVVNSGATSRVGVPFLDAVNRGEYVPTGGGEGGGNTFQISLTGGETDEADVEETLIPLLEDWALQRKLRLA